MIEVFGLPRDWMVRDKDHKVVPWLSLYECLLSFITIQQLNMIDVKSVEGILSSNEWWIDHPNMLSHEWVLSFVLQTFKNFYAISLIQNIEGVE